MTITIESLKSFGIQVDGTLNESVLNQIVLIITEEFGVNSIEDISQLVTAEDLVEEGIKKGPARKFMKYFYVSGNPSVSGTPDLEKKDTSTAGSGDILASSISNLAQAFTDTNVEGLPDRTLLERYEPKPHLSAVGKELKARYGEKHIIAFDGEKVDVDASLWLIQEIGQGFSDVTSTRSSSDNNLIQVLKVGEGPTRDSFDENPVRIGVPLRPSTGRCVETNLQWSLISLEFRQILRVALSLGLLKNYSDKELFNLVNDKDALTHLENEFPDAVLEFHRLENKPSLKIQKGNAANTSASGESSRMQANFSKSPFIIQ